MKDTASHKFPRSVARRSICRLGAALALLVCPTALCVGCDEDVIKEFRGASVDSIESGVKSILDGVVTGIFTVADPSGPDASEGTSTGG